MERQVTPLEASAALRTVEQERRRVIEEIDLPRWYWWFVALGWVALGVITDVGPPWSTVVATVAFGAVHSAIAPRVLSGRHRTKRLSVSAELADPRTPAYVLSGLVFLALVTALLGFAADADGAGHPATAASIVVALIVLLGGPQLLAWIRRRAAAT